ncbi:hypothetical protein LGH70_12065 [Hymenobacter sp. BT635]|uniref:Uncharacterized protein n=1 Tax=Hymenobacter nitidus TaxID=2880929 RepID=A0ABS8AD48_9BACT|nr:hypothetical protein [Hymenobacter nitidus]MCB2378325.1 hypothetical protein [Hymenobacter nitidus]
MARVTGNSLLRGISGKIGSITVRQVGNQTIVSAAEGQKRGAGSPKQQEQRGRMHLARLYAQAQLLDPATKALYATGITTRLNNARLVAITDFMNAPVVTAVDLSGYHGQAGDSIRIRATDDFAVTAVLVRLYTPLGKLAAEAAATLQPDTSWLYHTLTAGPYQPGTRIEVEAQDRPGNKTHWSFTL